MDMALLSRWIGRRSLSMSPKKFFQKQAISKLTTTLNCTTGSATERDVTVAPDQTQPPRCSTYLHAATKVGPMQRRKRRLGLNTKICAHGAAPSTYAWLTHRSIPHVTCPLNSSPIRSHPTIACPAHDRPSGKLRRAPTHPSPATNWATGVIPKTSFHLGQHGTCPHHPMSGSHLRSAATNCCLYSHPQA